MSPPRADRPAAKPQFESFAIQVEAKPGRSARRVVARIVQEELGDAWRIRPLNEPSGEFNVWRAARLGTPRAWNLTYQLRKRPEIVYAEPLFRISTTEQHVTPPSRGRRRLRSGGDDDDPATDGRFEWSLEHLRAREAWALFGNRTPGEGVIVGHPDTGFTKHPEIWDESRLTSGYDFEDEDEDATDPLVDGLLRSPGHGTGTASVIFSAPGSPGVGVAEPFVSGIAPGASLISIRTTKSVVLWSMERLTRAIRFAIQNGSHVISISLGGPWGSSALHNAVKDAEQAGVIVLAAAGNRVGFVVWPAVYDEVIAVAASTVHRKAWNGSCHGEEVDVAAPGASVWRARTERRSGTHRFLVNRGSGTSFAVAAAAGSSALWLSFHGRQSLVQRYGLNRIAGVFKQLLEKTCVPPPGWEKDEYGKGIVDAARLLSEPLPAVAPARGMRGVARRAVSEDATGIETLVHLLDTVPRSSVERVVAALLRVPEKELPRTLQRVGDELTFHVGTDPALRAQLEVAARRPPARVSRRGEPRPDRLSPARRRISGRGTSERLERILRGID
jgi:thermitase